MGLHSRGRFSGESTNGRKTERRGQFLKWIVASHVKFMETKGSSQGATVSHDEPESVEFFGSDDTEGSDSDEIPF